jgi:serine protease AprX
VTISGLPANVTSGTVYTENRSVAVTNGSLSDTFGQWDVHVYHFDTSVVSTPPDFSLSASPASQSIVRGRSASYAVAVTPTGGFGGNVDLSVGGLPAGASASFTPNPATTNATLSVQTAAGTKTGAYTLTITGTSGSLKRTTTVTLQIKRK